MHIKLSYIRIYRGAGQSPCPQSKHVRREKKVLSLIGIFDDILFNPLISIPEAPEIECSQYHLFFPGLKVRNTRNVGSSTSSLIHATRICDNKTSDSGIDYTRKWALYPLSLIAIK